MFGRGDELNAGDSAIREQMLIGPRHDKHSAQEEERRYDQERARSRRTPITISARIKRRRARRRRDSAMLPRVSEANRGYTLALAIGAACIRYNPLMMLIITARGKKNKSCSWYKLLCDTHVQTRQPLLGARAFVRAGSDRAAVAVGRLAGLAEPLVERPAAPQPPTHKDAVGWSYSVSGRSSGVEARFVFLGCSI